MKVKVPTRNQVGCYISYGEIRPDPDSLKPQRDLPDLEMSGV